MERPPLLPPCPSRPSGRPPPHPGSCFCRLYRALPRPRQGLAPILPEEINCENCVRNSETKKPLQSWWSEFLVFLIMRSGIDPQELADHTNTFFSLQGPSKTALRCIGSRIQRVVRHRPIMACAQLKSMKDRLKIGIKHEENMKLLNRVPTLRSQA